MAQMVVVIHHAVPREMWEIFGRAGETFAVFSSGIPKPNRSDF
jgi:hypothetical protein